MIVRRSRLVLEADEAQIVATVESENGNFAPFDLKMGVPIAYVGWLDRSGSPFVPTVLLLAGVLEERLCLEDSVSPLLLGNARKACELFRSWWGVAPVTIEAQADTAQRRAGQGVALFFSRGVDSWFSALRYMDEVQPRRLSHLIYAADLDRQYTPPSRRRALNRTREAAASIGLPLIPVSHNGRPLLDRFINWERSHGGVLAGIALALGGWLSEVFIASSYDVNHLIPWGSHPDLDPLWSSERTAIRVDGAEVTRTEKVQALASSNVALSQLKVCWRDDIDANCGRCEKCVRTQCALLIAGALERAPVFLRPLTVESVAGLSRPEPGTSATVTPYWVDLCERFPGDPSFAELRAAACLQLPSWHPLATAGKQRDRPAIPIHARPGSAYFLLPESAGELGLTPATAMEEGPGIELKPSQIELTWTVPAPDRIPLPLRPPRAMMLGILDSCREVEQRPVPWCLIAHDSRSAARLLERLTESWGPGIACLTGTKNADRDHGISRLEASLIQRHSLIRVWWGEGDYLDPYLVLESLRHGCLPLQCTTEADSEMLAACLPAGLSAFTLGVPGHAPVSALSREERMARLDSGLSVVLSGSLARDLARIAPSLNGRPQ